MKININMFKKISMYVIVFIIILYPIFVFALDTTPPPPPTTSSNIDIPNPLKSGVGDNLMSLIVSILEIIVLPIAVVFVVIWIIYAGLKYVTAQGNPAKISEAHKTLLWSLIGAGILLGAVGISEVVQNTVTGLIE